MCTCTSALTQRRSAPSSHGRDGSATAASAVVAAGTCSSRCCGSAPGTLHDLDAHLARGHLDKLIAGSVEVARLEGMLVAVEFRVMGPSARGGVEASRRIRYRHARRRHARPCSSRTVRCTSPPGRSKRRCVTSSARELAARDIEQPQLRAALAVRNEGDLLPVRRPARVRSRPSRRRSAGNGSPPLAGISHSCSQLRPR